MDISNYVTVGTAVLTAIGGYLTARATIKKAYAESEAQAIKAEAEAKFLRAQAEKTVGEAWEKLSSNMQDRMDAQDKKISDQDKRIADLKEYAYSLENRVSDLEHENKDLKAWSEKLIHQLRTAKIEPVPFERSRKENKV